MADTRVLREKLLAEIRRLQDHVKDLDKVEQLEAQLSRNGGPPEAPPRLRRPPSKSAADLIKGICQRQPDRPWTTVLLDEEIKKLGYRGVNRSNIGVTLRRLREDGLFEVVSKSPKEGNVYKWKGSRS